MNTIFNDIKFTVMDDQVWFVGTDIAAAIGFPNPNQAVIDNVKEEDRHYELINIAGAIHLSYISPTPAASRLKKWILNYILPVCYGNGNTETVKDEAERIVRNIPPKVLPYVKNLLEPFSSAEENYTGSLIIKPSAEIDKAFESYMAIHNYYAKGGDLTVNELKEAQGVGTAISNTAHFFGSRTHKLMSKPDKIAYCCSSINKDGSVRIPKIGTYQVDPPLIIPSNRRVTLITIKRTDDDQFKVKVNTRRMQ